MALNLYLDTQNKRLVASATSTSQASGIAFVQNDVLRLAVYPLVAQASITTPFLADSWLNYSVSVALCGDAGQPVGSTTPTLIAVQPSMDWSVDHVSGSLNLGLSALATFLGNRYSRKSTLEIEAVDPTGNKSRYQFPCTIYAAVIRDQSALDTSSSSSASTSSLSSLSSNSSSSSSKSSQSSPSSNSSSSSSASSNSSSSSSNSSSSSSTSSLSSSSTAVSETSSSSSPSSDSTSSDSTSSASSQSA